MKVRYPYRSDNKFLKRYTNTIAQITSMVDELVSTCFQMEGKMWDECAELFENDSYVDWKKRTKNADLHGEKETSTGNLSEDALTLANNKILRREEK